MIRNTITKYSNDIDQRCTLMTGMPASNYDNFRTWGLRLKEQSKRCKWGEEYTWEVDALDTLLYQCPDDQWKTKILGNPRWKFQEFLDYGCRMASAKKQSQEVNMAQKATSRDNIAMDRVVETIKDCNFCCGDHEKGKCPTWGKKGQTCGGKGHNPSSSLCKGKKKWNPGQGGGQARSQRGGANARGGGRSTQKQSGTPQSHYKTVFRREGNQWVKKKQTVSYLEEDADSEDSEYEYEAKRIDVNKLGPSQAPTIVKLTPTDDAKYPTKVPWTTDSGDIKTLLSEKHFWKVMDHNPEVKLRHTKVGFRPYSTNVTVPLLGKMKVKLTNNNGYHIVSTVYVIKGQNKSLLRQEDAIALGIIQMNPDRHKLTKEHAPRPSTRDDTRLRSRSPEPVRYITPETLRDPKEEGIVSGGQTQTEIDANMDRITTEHTAVFEGMGRAKVDPIHIQVKEGDRPVTQGKRRIHLRKAILKKLKEMKEHDLIEGPLPARECKGWLSNMVVTKKKWDSEEVRINIDTKRMNSALVPTKIPIPTPEQLRHKMAGSEKEISQF